MTAPAGRFRAVALLDRDGTVNEEVNYLSREDQFVLLNGAADAIRILNGEGVAAVLTTNQSGIARGFFTEETLAAVHAKMNRLLAADGAQLDAIYYSPSLPDAGDIRRKPGRGMYDDAVRDLKLEGLPVYSIGDRTLDMEFGIAIGGKGIRVLTGHNIKEDIPYNPGALRGTGEKPQAFVCEDLLHAVHLLLSDLILDERNHDRSLRAKFVNLYDMGRVVAEQRSQGLRVVLANGCFDILHGGHISYLEAARAMGDRLVVAVNSNAVIARLKGAGRPILSEPDRLQILAALRCVDYLTIFYDESADRVLQVLKPDIHAKGTDYTSENVPELATARRLGIQTRIAGDPKENSSRGIIELVVERARAGVL